MKKFTICLALFIATSAIYAQKFDTLKPKVFTTDPCSKTLTLYPMGTQGKGYNTGNNDFNGGTADIAQYFDKSYGPCYVYGMVVKTKNDSKTSTSTLYGVIYEVWTIYGQSNISEKSRSNVVYMNQVADNGYTHFSFPEPYKIDQYSALAGIELPKGANDIMAVYCTDFLKSCSSGNQGAWERGNPPADPKLFAKWEKWSKNWSYDDGAGNTVYPDIDLSIFLLTSKTLDIKDNAKPNSLKVYENMEEQQIFITNQLSNNNPVEVNIYDMRGQLIKTEKFSENFKNIDIKDLSKGLYIVKVISENEVVTKKIVKG